MISHLCSFAGYRYLENGEGNQILVTVSDDPAALSTNLESSRCADANYKGEIKDNWVYTQCEQLIRGRYVRIAPLWTFQYVGSFCVVEFEVVGFTD